MTDDVTLWLQRWREGHPDAERELIERVYPVMRALAQERLRGIRGDFSLQATELANEAYLVLARQHGVQWQNRGHFYAIAARVIRRLVIDHLRERGAQKRGGGDQLLALHEIAESEHPGSEAGFDWLALDEALQDLERNDARRARLVELRYFVGLSVEQAAEALDISVPTAVRQWRFARAWLAERLEPMR